MCWEAKIRTQLKVARSNSPPREATALQAHSLLANMASRWLYPQRWLYGTNPIIQVNVSHFQDTSRVSEKLRAVTSRFQ
jgi:hypothetical protein